MIEFPLEKRDGAAENGRVQIARDMAAMRRREEVAAGEVLGKAPSTKRQAPEKLQISIVRCALEGEQQTGEQNLEIRDNTGRAGSLWLAFARICSHLLAFLWGALRIAEPGKHPTSNLELPTSNGDGSIQVHLMGVSA